LQGATKLCVSDWRLQRGDGVKLDELQVYSGLPSEVVAVFNNQATDFTKCKKFHFGKSETAAEAIYRPLEAARSHPCSKFARQINAMST
jgi:hypothetical protein